MFNETTIYKRSVIRHTWLSTLGTKHLSFDHSTLDTLVLKMSALEIGRMSEKDLAKIALEEVNENPDRIASDIQMIKEWLEKQPHLQNICKGSQLS